MSDFFNIFKFKPLKHGKPFKPLEKNTIISVITDKNIIKVAPFYRFKMEWPIMGYLEQDITELKITSIMFTQEKIDAMKNLTFEKPHDARRAGLKIYDHPEVCPKNPLHGRERYMTTGYCCACNVEKQRAKTNRRKLQCIVHESNLDLAAHFVKLFENRLSLQQRSDLIGLKKEIETA